MNPIIGAHTDCGRMTTVSDLTAFLPFLRARLDEDAEYLRTMIEVGQRGAAAATPKDLADIGAVAIGLLSDPQVLPVLERWTETGVPVPNDMRRLLREVEVKREIVQSYDLDFNDDGEPICLGGYGEAYWDVIRAFGAVYSDHLDYQPGWKP